MPDSRLEFPFGENSQAYQLAFLLQCISDEELKFDQIVGELKEAHKKTMTSLRVELARLQRNILTGQKEMFEPPPQEVRISEVQGEIAHD